MKYKLKKPSVEQGRIVDSARSNNVVVKAVAGAGKTTTFLHIASRYPEKSSLLLTYNARLKEETREKAQMLGFQEHLEVHSFHAFATKYISSIAYTDTGIRTILQQPRIHTLRQVPHFDILMIDESQDMTPLYYEFICRICKELCSFQNIIVVGDERQCIFEYVDADPRYIAFADSLFQIVPTTSWKTLTLSNSFRISHEMSLFINKCMYKQDVIHAKKIGPKPKYIICDAFHARKLFDMVQDYLKDGHNCDDIFILAPSVKTDRSPVRQFANMFTAAGLPVYLPMSDDERMDPDVLKHKIVLSTFHQVKGLERKFVIVFCFDNSYFKFFGSSLNPFVCPNIFYVATTRASEQLLLVHHYENDYLPFIDTHSLSLYCDVHEFVNLNIKKEFFGSTKPRDVPVTNLIRNLPEKVMYDALSFIDIEQVCIEEDRLSIPTKTRQGNLVESVAEINGTAIPLYFQWKCYKRLTDLPIDTKDVRRHMDAIPLYHSIYTNIRQKISTDQIQISDMLQLVNVYNSVSSRVYFKSFQIENYNWIEPLELEKCMQRMRQKISCFAKYEVELDIIVKGNFHLNGRADCIDTDTLWELKCTNELSPEHTLQLACYMYMHQKTRLSMNTNRCCYRLWNILTNEELRITSTPDRLEQMVAYLIQSKYYPNNKTTDDDFLQTMQKIRNRKQLPALRFL